jgi:hypothetical protein
MKKIFMETTAISPNKSVSEIQYLLAEYGASAILIEYEEGGIRAVSFKYSTNGQETPYRIPCQWQEIKGLLERKHKRKPYKKNLEYEAKMIAWRQARRWVEAQLAFLQAKQAKFEQLFLSHRLVGPNETLYERLEVLKFNLPMISYKKEKEENHDIP